jgi:hypothetical protein
MANVTLKPDDIFINRIKTHPERRFFIYNSEVYVDNNPNVSGSNTTELSVPAGYISLYELNIDRASDKIYLFTDDPRYKFADKKNFNRMVGLPHRSTTDGNDFVVSDPQITSSLPMSASISRIYSTSETNYFSDLVTTYEINKYTSALRASAENYINLSPHYSFTPIGNLTRDLTKTTCNLINIPTIFYESTIKKKSVKLSYYITGSLIAECSDTRSNGELVETTGSNVGSVVGVVLYDEGLIVLSASYDLDSSNGVIYSGASGTAASASWLYYGAGAEDNITHHTSIASASYGLEYQGTSYTNVLTMLCHFPKGAFNHSNNPTFVDKNAASGSLATINTSSYSYQEPRHKIKNIVSSSYSGYDEDFERVTYISKIGIYDEDGELIMIASLANPLRKREQDEFTVKLTYDI